MRRVLEKATRVANSDATVLIQGETGTGKELIARIIHVRSKRRRHPFVAVNCGAYTDSLLASELFGHVRGAFTGAVVDRAGDFEAASEGTVLLDEIGAMSPAMQVKVLRVLQERRVVRVGSTKEIPVHARVVAATNADLANLVRTGKFREDLYYRVKVVTCRIPPLRERRDDVRPLIDHYLDHFSRANDKREIRLSPETWDILLHHDWPGNVRQLRSELEQIVAMADCGDVVTPDALSDDLRSEPAGERDQTADRAETDSTRASSGASPSSDATYQELLDHWTRNVVADRLERCGGNITRTAQSLAISRSTLYALLKKYGFHGQDD